jgi:3-isopropylmalate dehydratase small subunit
VRYVTKEEYAVTLQAHIDVLDIIKDEFLKADGKDMFHVGVFSDLLHQAREYMEEAS